VKRPLPNELLFRWRDSFCSGDGPPAVTRLVLWTLSKHMGMDGTDCFPKQETIALESGLGLRTVKEHLERAEQLGWISRRPRRRGDRRSWRYGTDYVPRFPIPNGARTAPIPARLNGADHANIGAAHATLVRQPPTSTSKNSSPELNDAFKKSASGKRVEKARTGRTEFVASMDAYDAAQRRAA
jgi:hypothetical protein